MITYLSAALAAWAMASKLLVTFSTARKPLPTTGPLVRSSTSLSSASVMILLFSFLPSAVFDGSKASSSLSSPAWLGLGLGFR